MEIHEDLGFGMTASTDASDLSKRRAAQHEVVGVLHFEGDLSNRHKQSSAESQAEIAFTRAARRHPLGWVTKMRTSVSQDFG